MKPHPQLKNCHSQNLGSLRIGTFDEFGTAFPEHRNNRAQALV